MKNLIVLATLLLALLRSATAIRCYVCNTTSTLKAPFQCSEWFDRYDYPDIEPEDCSNVHDAKYCIKHIGRFEAGAIECYQCDTIKDGLQCSNLLINEPDTSLTPMSCDHVIEAEFCIKLEFAGGVGAKRYCSSKDLGNYCDYVQNKGDIREYRSCIYTCDTDGCNHGSSFRAFTVSSLIGLGFMLKMLA